MFITRYLNKANGIKLLALMLITLVVSILIMSMVPPVSKDALVHHLAIPKLYLNHGSLYEIPFMRFSYFPMNLDLLYMIPLYFGNDILPKLIHFTFAFLTAGLVFYYLKKRAGFIYGLSGALFFLSIPVIVKLSITVYVDLGIIFFSFAALLLIMKWLQKGFKTRYLVCSGIMCGLALGTKYNGLITFALLSLFIPYLYSRFSKDKKLLFSRSLSCCLSFVFIALIVFSPWMIRNYSWKENPIYPLYNNVFNPPKITAQKVKKETVEGRVRQNKGFFTYRNTIYGESGWEIAMLPARIFFQGKDGDPQYFDGKLNPFLLLFTIAAFLPLKNVPTHIRREKMIMLAFSTLFFFIAFFTAVLRIRYISPIIPPLTVLSILGIKNLLDILKDASSQLIKLSGTVFVVFLFIFSLALNGNYIVNLFRAVDPLAYISGKITSDEYISKFIPEYPALRYINKNLASDSKIFLIYLGKRGYYCDRDYEFNLGFLHNLILKARNPEDILSGFQKKNITHLLISHPVFNKWVKNNCSTDKQNIIKTFFRDFTVTDFYKDGVGLHTMLEF